MTERRKRGRPPGATKEAGEVVSAWMPRSQYDRLCQIAHRHGYSVSALVRKAVVVGLRLDPKPDSPS